MFDEVVCFGVFRVAGASFRQEAIKQVPLRSRVRLEPEPHNPEDHEAIAVYAKDQKLGFLPASEKTGGRIAHIFARLPSELLSKISGDIVWKGDRGPGTFIGVRIALWAFPQSDTEKKIFADLAEALEEEVRRCVEADASS